MIKKLTLQQNLLGLISANVDHPPAPLCSLRSAFAYDLPKQLHILFVILFYGQQYRHKKRIRPWKRSTF
jgi:hypothetical protein